MWIRAGSEFVVQAEKKRARKEREEDECIPALCNSSDEMRTVLLCYCTSREQSLAAAGPEACDLQVRTAFRPKN